MKHLRTRLDRLEERHTPATAAPRFIIRFIDPGGGCTAIMDCATGRRYAPDDPAAPTDPADAEKVYVNLDFDAI